MSGKKRVIVIGGGHNGLITAAYLAKAGLSVQVMEKRPFPGGVAITEEFHPGFRVDSILHDAGTLRQQVIKDLYLKMHGLELRSPDPVTFAPHPDGKALTLWQDSGRTAAEIGGFDTRDGANYLAYHQMMDKYAAFLESALAQMPPDPNQLDASTAFSWLGVGTSLRRLGANDMYRLLRMLPMSAEEFLSEWFQHEFVQGVFAGPAISFIRQGPFSGGTALQLLYHHLGQRLGGLPSTAQASGGMAQLTTALANAARAFGATIRTEAAIERIVVENGRATGVMLTDGQQLAADLVLSSANPYHTFIDLVTPYELDTTFVNALRRIKFRGALAKVHLALDQLPAFTAIPAGQTHLLRGRIQISPSLHYLEKAYDAAKYGRFSKRPFLDIRIPSLIHPNYAPEGQHVLSIQMQYAPYTLRDTNWDEQRSALTETVITTLSQYAPDLPDHIIGQQTLTPADLEADYGLREGSIYHGEMMLDQMLFMRPVPGWGQYQTPIAGLYLCGAGCHPGGGLTGEPGRLAAQAVLGNRQKVFNEH